jgi:hypothetical protein
MQRGVVTYFHHFHSAGAALYSLEHAHDQSCQRCTHGLLPISIFFLARFHRALVKILAKLADRSSELVVSYEDAIDEETEPCSVTIHLMGRHRTSRHCDNLVALLGRRPSIFINVAGPSV